MCNGSPNQQYTTLDDAFDHLNAELFDGQLPMVIITLQRKANTKGYYRHDGFASRGEDGSKVSEIALNPSVFSERTDEEILSTLAHEMCHLWQFKFGDPGSGRYHNTEWACKMKEIGLQPVAANGKETGQKVTHEIVEGGAFNTSISTFLEGRSLLWQATDGDGSDGKTKSGEPKKKSKVKYTCPDCQQNAWAKPESNLMCGDCVQVMESEDEDEGGESNG